MNEVDFQTIETTLRITLPSAFRTIMAAEGASLLTLLKRHCAEVKLRKFSPKHDLFGRVFLSPEILIESNLNERRNNDTNPGFPDWHHNFVMIGTNAAGGYVSLRLDDKPGVWMIGTDSGKKPTKTATTFHDHVAEVANDYRFDLHRVVEAVAHPVMSMGSWKKLKGAAPEFKKLRKSYSDWTSKTLPPPRGTINVDVSPSRFLKWCTDRRRKPQMDSLQEFVNDCLRAKRHK